MAAVPETQMIVKRAADELEALFRDHHHRVISTAYRITGSLADAEDVAQSVFLRLARGEVDLSGVQNMGAYLHRTAVNAALDLLRARRDSQFSTLEDAGELHSKNPALSPDRMQHASETRELLRKALARLHPRTAEMFVLRYIEDYDNREIAKVMKTSQAVVAVTLHRTRARLKKDLRGLMRGRV